MKRGDRQGDRQFWRNARTATLSHRASQSKYFLEFAPDDYEEQAPIEVVEQGNNGVQAPIEIVEQNNLKETYQNWEGTYALLGEFVRSLLKNKRREDIAAANAVVMEFLASKDVSVIQHLVSRAALQISGPALKAKPIEQSYKRKSKLNSNVTPPSVNPVSKTEAKPIEHSYERRSKLNSERRTKRRCKVDDENLEEEADKICSTERALLQSCFVCGKLVPNDENGETGDIEWERPEMAGKLIVTVLPSSGERYLSTPLYANIRDEAMDLGVNSLKTDLSRVSLPEFPVEECHEDH